MTKKDFELIADVLNAAGENRLDHYATISVFASALERTNPRFNRAAFIAAALHGTGRS